MSNNCEVQAMIRCQYLMCIQATSPKKPNSWCIRNTSWLCLLTLFIAVLSGCTTKPSLENQTTININHNVAQLTQWKLKGKIAWITDAQRTSAYMNWQQDDANIAFTLTNVLGINMASLSYDGKLAKLSADGKEYQGASPSLLIFQTTGWQVPISALSSWVKGMPSPVEQKNKQGDVIQNAHITRYDNGLIQQIKPYCATELKYNTQCNAWVIDYTSYTSAIINNIEYQLPTNISMYNRASNATIKIRISEWS